MAAVLRALGVVLAKVFGDNAVRWVAGKALLTGLSLVTLPLILNNFLYDIMDILFQWVGGNVDGSSLDASQSFTGLCAYLMGLLKVSECISVIVSGMLVKVTLRHVPFLRL